MSTHSAAVSTTALPAGVWQVDPSAGTIEFTARGMFGLVPAKGTFSEYTGNLTVDGDGARGELRIAATSLDTGNAKRDTHLRSEDFFDVANHPTVTFTSTSVDGGQDAGLTLAGILAIRDNRLEVTAPLTATVLEDDRLRLSTTLSVDRAAAGVGWSKMGMIKGKAQLHVTVELTRAENGQAQDARL